MGFTKDRARYKISYNVTIGPSAGVKVRDPHVLIRAKIRNSGIFGRKVKKCGQIRTNSGKKWIKWVRFRQIRASNWEIMANSGKFVWTNEEIRAISEKHHQSNLRPYTYDPLVWSHSLTRAIMLNSHCLQIDCRWNNLGNIFNIRRYDTAWKRL